MLASKFCRLNKVLVTSSTNPHLNLSKELDLLLAPPRDDKVLFVWRNSPVVTIGRHQDPFKECDLDYMKENGVALLRRTSGGGAQYQDLAQTHWALLDREPDARTNTEILLSTLRSLAINPRVMPTGGVLIGNSAVFQPSAVQTCGRSMFRGTFRFGSDRSTAARCLIGFSDRALPIDLGGLGHDVFVDALVRAFREYTGNCQVRYLDHSALMSDPNVRHRFKELSSKRWLFGKATARKTIVSRKFEFGKFDVALMLEGERVKQAMVLSDCLVPDVVEKFENCINEVGRSRLPLVLSQRIYKPETRTPQEREMTAQLVQWIIPEIRKWKFVR
jgi:lipoate-protein ligase A